MELKQKYTEETRSDIDVLKDIVEMVMSVDLMATNRKRCVVEARMMYTGILRECNYSLNRIGMSLKKDHTTIIHYLSSLRKLLDVDIELRRKYIKCMEIFMNERDPLTATNKETLTVEVLKLNTKLDILTKEKNNLLNEIKKMKEEIKPMDKRLGNIMKLIDENTKVGHEFIIERKIRKLFDE
jgi:hypothetical protein